MDDGDDGDHEEHRQSSSMPNLYEMLNARQRRSQPQSTESTPRQHNISIGIIVAVNFVVDNTGYDAYIVLLPVHSLLRHFVG